ncbi:MAG: hypothetical protein ACO2PM_21055 [Pyrobaculum sp.]
MAVGEAERLRREAVFLRERLTVAQFRLKAGCVVQRHSHLQEQITVRLFPVTDIG